MIRDANPAPDNRSGGATAVVNAGGCDLTWLERSTSRGRHAGW